jgi:hypothetical protein
MRLRRSRKHVLKHGIASLVVFAHKGEDSMANDVPEQAFDRPFRPYALQIGFMLRDWNRLQTTLGELFATLITPKNDKLGHSL